MTGSAAGCPRYLRSASGGRSATQRVGRSRRRLFVELVVDAAVEVLFYDDALSVCSTLPVANYVGAAANQIGFETEGA